MLSVLTNSWALLLGMLLLMLGNGLHGTLLGVRGEIESFSTFEMSIIMSAYFAGFLVASRFVPDMIRRVGHVRVFAALGSLVSAVLIHFSASNEPHCLDCRTRDNWVLFLRCLCHGGKLAQQCCLKRKQRQSAVALYDCANGGNCSWSGAFAVG